MSTSILVLLIVFALPYLWLILFLFPWGEPIFCASMWQIFKRMNYSRILTMIPFYNFRIFLNALNLPSKYLFLLFVPLLNWFVIIKVFLRIVYFFNRDKYFAVGLFILPWIFFPILAYSKKPNKEFNNEMSIKSSEVGIVFSVFFLSIWTSVLFISALNFSIDKTTWIFLLTPVAIWIVSFIVDLISNSIISNNLKKIDNLRFLKFYLPAIFYTFYMIPTLLYLVYRIWWSDFTIWIKLIGTYINLITAIRLGNIINFIKITYLSKIAFRKGDKKINFRGKEFSIEDFTIN